MDERARRCPTAHPCANATARLPIEWEAIPVSANSYASPSDQTPQMTLLRGLSWRIGYSALE